MEDFGYKKTYDNTELSRAAKRVLLGTATLFSLAIFVYITISAYYFVHQGKESDIETIESPEGPIKVMAEEEESEIQVDYNIYEDIFGSNQKSSKQKTVKIRAHQEPALPGTKSRLQEVATGKKDEEKIVVYSAEKKEEVKQIMAQSDERNLEKRDNTAAPPQAKFTGRRVVKVQIAAMSSRSAAVEHWQKLNSLYLPIFSGLKPFVERVDLGKRGIFYRLQVGNFSNQVEAEKFCSRYVIQARKSSADCIIVE